MAAKRQRPRGPTNKPTVEERRAHLISCTEAVAALARSRVIVAQHVRKLEDDHEIRKVLDAVVRRWSELLPASYFTQGSLGGTSARRQKDHLVPRRVLVDRMIMDPSECRALLECAVVLVEVSGEEHRTLGGIFADHPDIYSEMLGADVAELVDLGRRRYERFGIEPEPFIF